jgi:hypothetical protein
MACSQCFHNSVCGSASPYSDSSQCKTFVDKDSMVSIDVLHQIHNRCQKLQEERNALTADLHTMRACMAENEEELRYLRIIKQTLEMCSGSTFVF